MNTRKANTVLLAASLAGVVFRRADVDAMRVPDPDMGGGSICGITRDPTARGFLFAPDDPGPSPGDDVKFDDKQQAKLNSLLAAEKKKGQAALEDLQGQLKAQKSELDKLTAESAKRLEEEAKSKEELELKGKTDLEKLQHQILKGADALKERDARIAKMEADGAAALKASQERLDGFVKRSIALASLGSFVAEGAGDDAAKAFLENAQVEIDENLKLSKIVYGGNVFEKPMEAAQAFLKDRPYYAKAPEGGTGNRKNGGTGGTKISGLSGNEQIAKGLKEPVYGV